MMPLELNKLELEDALIYGLRVDTMAQTAVLTVEIDTAYHKDVAAVVGLDVVGVTLLDFVFLGTTSASMKGLLPRKSGLAVDEPPHNYEISSWKVTNTPWSKDRYRLDVRCQNSPRCQVEFAGVHVTRSATVPGVVHDYGI